MKQATVVTKTKDSPSKITNILLQENKQITDKIATSKDLKRESKTNRFTGKPTSL